MEDVLALHGKPLCEHDPVVYIGEKPVVLHADVRPGRPMRPWKIARYDCEYKRCGTANVFCVLHPKVGRHFTKVTTTRSPLEFTDHRLEIAVSDVTATTIHPVMDKLSTHSRIAVVERFGEKWERFTLHYAPERGSWLNQDEIEISLFSRRCGGQRRIPSHGDLRWEARARNRKMNRDRTTIDRRFTRMEARAKFDYKRKHTTRSETWDGIVARHTSSRCFLNQRVACPDSRSLPNVKYILV
jgi:hypothetical protein